MSEYYKKIDNSICPYCGQKMRNVRDGTMFSVECRSCKIKFRFVDDAGGGGYREIKEQKKAR